MVKQALTLSLFISLFASGYAASDSYIYGCGSYVTPIHATNTSITCYSVNYANDSKQPTSLKNATLNLQLFANGSPVGMMTVTTNVMQAFILSNNYDNTLVVAVLSVNPSNNKMLCQGISKIGEREITIRCKNK